jgi:DNA-nicking Smr family endonuclease
MSKYRRDISAAEQHLWHHATRNVRAYQTHGRKVDVSDRPTAHSLAVSSPTISTSEIITNKKLQKLSPVATGTSPNIDRRTRTKFKRGKLPIDGRIDLHGLTLGQAHAEFTVFVNSAYTRQARCILVITGKGRGAEQVGKIRRELPHWINDPALRSLVLAATEAQIRDGGSGAFYVLLKRKRAGCA